MGTPDIAEPIVIQRAAAQTELARTGIDYTLWVLAGLTLLALGLLCLGVGRELQEKADS